MSKRHREKSIRSPGIEGGSVSGSKPTPLVVQQAPGRPDLLQVSINAALAPPEKAMFADHVQVERVRDGVRLLFGKLHPTQTDTCTNAVEVSFPLRPFYNQLFKSIASARPGRLPFNKSAEQAVVRFGYERIASLEPVARFEKVAAFRSNFALMALHEDDAAIDFYHLDASTVQVAAQAVASQQGLPASTGFRGILRIVVSPSVLLFFLEQCVKLAAELKTGSVDLDDGEAIERGGTLP